MIRIIEPTTAAVPSPQPFMVARGGSPVSVSVYGLTGAEQVVIQKKRGDGTFADLTEDSAVLTVSQPNTSIVASGIYRTPKPVTAGAAGVDID